MNMRIVGTVASVMMIATVVSAMPADFQPRDGNFYKVSTKFRGTSMSLDVFNGGPQNNEIHLARDADVSGQYWHVAQVPGKDYYTLKSWFRGENMCLDVNMPSMHPHLNPCGNFTGQHWYIDRSVSGGPDFRVLTNRTQGGDMCLDVNPRDNSAEMRPCGNYTGQAWLFAETDKPVR